MIYTTKHKWSPCDLVPFKVDGQRMLIFPNGVTATTCGEFEVGHQSHFATCPKADEFRPEPEPKKPEIPPSERSAPLGCGCMGGWR
jgi:hypothetical protein